MTSFLTAIKNYVIKYCTTVYERNGKKLFWSIKNSGEILNKLKSIGFLASGLSTYDLSTLYTTLPHNLIKEKLTELIEQTFNREGSLYLASSYVADFNTRNKLLTQKLLKQGYRYHKLRKTFSKFYRRYYDLISKFQVGLKSLLRQGLSEPDFYGDLVYKLKKIVGSNNFSAQFIKIISHYKKDWL